MLFRNLTYIVSNGIFPAPRPLSQNLAIILTTLTYNPEGVRSKGFRLYTLPRASILLVQKTEARLKILCLKILLLQNMNENKSKLHKMCYTLYFTIYRKVKYKQSPKTINVGQSLRYIIYHLTLLNLQESENF